MCPRVSFCGLVKIKLMACEGYPFTVATDPYTIRGKPEGVPCSHRQVLNTQRPLSLLWELSNTCLIQNIVCISTEHRRLAADLWSAISYNHCVNREVPLLRGTMCDGREVHYLAKFLDPQTGIWEVPMNFILWIYRLCCSLPKPHKTG